MWREVVEALRRVAGFQALELVRAVDALREGLSSSDLRILAFTGNLVATGLREWFAEALRRGLFNVVITTAGACDHDIAKAMGARYEPGSFDADDAKLLEAGVHRLGNVFIRREHYGPLVEKAVLDALSGAEGEMGSREICRLIGLRLGEDSILGAAARRGVPVYVPGIVDGAVGTAILTLNDLARIGRGRRIVLNLLLDEAELRDKFVEARQATALIIGGGIAKHHTIWWAQFRGGLDYVVYVSTATEYDGSLSGARPREAVSWGKVKPGARQVYVFADATIAVPIILGYLMEELSHVR